MASRGRPRHAPRASPAGGGHANMQGLGVGTGEDRGLAAPSSWAGGRCRVEDGACQAALLPGLGDRVVAREGRAAGRNTGRPGPGDGSAEDLGDKAVAGLAARGAECHLSAPRSVRQPHRLRRVSPLRTARPHGLRLHSRARAARLGPIRDALRERHRASHG